MKREHTGDERKRIVVIGGGFAGLNFVKKLNPKRFDITLIDKNNYHSFSPLFYQVASAGLDPASICFPLRRELKKLRRGVCGVTYRMGCVTGINPEEQTVSTDRGAVAYDILVIAAGTSNNFFHIPDLQNRVYTLKSTAQALRCRNAILERLELASTEKDPERKRRLLSFIVIGGGPTGVEIAGALGEMKRYVIPREYPKINPDEVSITLVEGSDRLLGAFHPKTSAAARRQLEQLMVKITLGVNVQQFDGHQARLSDGSELTADTVIWTAGVTACSFNFDTDIPKEQYIGHGGRLKVDGFCRVPALPGEVYALGDIAIMTEGTEIDPAFPHGHPQLAQPALQQGRLLAHNLMKPDRKRPFRYHDKGAMATIGRNRAVVELKHVQFSGWTAWMAWMFIHLISILGFRNKVTVLINWIWAYFNYSTSLRLLIIPSKMPDKVPRE